MDIDITKMRAMAKHILEHAIEFEWSLQGLGMLRLHLSEDCRLHIWDLRHAFPGASPIHDHQQWGLHSTVLSGQLTNYIYCESSHPSAEDYLYQTIRAGYGCVSIHEPRVIRLRENSRRIYFVGDSYEQEPEQIHRTDPVNGTVTIMSKSPTKDAQHARVFWPAGEQWGTAEPRPAKSGEILAISKYALSIWR